ncbi:MAG: 5'-methylthioadenosine/adenosylhomocysteine nucleosidase [Clostridiales bacterium]|nr:5'-methylthioadenosine/adenosylhomocysteine nucleosidase [Clostridiales bacterium]
MLGIIGAMDIEISAIRKKIENPVSTEYAGTKYVCGYISSVMVCTAVCSPGKVNAALCAQAMIDKFSVDKIINTGVGCSLSKEVVIKNIVIASNVCQYDIDITALGEPRGYINGLNTIKIPADKQISDTLAGIAVTSGEKIHRGTIASGDTFIADASVKENIANAFNAICGEMEGGAIGQVCAANKIPFAVLRSVSDGGNSDSAIDYPAFKKIAAEKSAAIILKYIANEKIQQEF